MGENKSSISEAQSYREIGEFWDSHDITDYWEQTEPVEFEVDIQSEARYYALEPVLAAGVSKLAWKKGISVETLINLWVQERLEKEQTRVQAAA